MAIILTEKLKEFINILDELVKLGELDADDENEILKIIQKSQIKRWKK